MEAADANAPRHVSLTVDYQPVEADVPPYMMLLDFLNRRLGLTGTQRSCSAGRCGYCAVRVDGRLTMSCVTPAVELDGCEVVTIEAPGMGSGKLLFGEWPTNEG